MNCPNDLPVSCLSARGEMLECEHGDHPDYMFPVTALYVGADEEKFIERHGDTVVDCGRELHALIYTDGTIALTMYECCYSMWSVGDGKILNEHLWYKKGEWRLDEKSLERIRNCSR